MNDNDLLSLSSALDTQDRSNPPLKDAIAYKLDRTTLYLVPWPEIFKEKRL